VVYTLFQLVKDRTDVLSAAFTCGPIPGGIFIEANLKPDILNTICHIPGIMKRGGKPIVKFIPIEDHIGLIRLPKDMELRFTVGQWVQVTKGIYKGDLGYVKGLKPWGGVQLLLVPRIKLPASSLQQKQGKQPRTTPPP
jgi:hypothetical protein